MHAVGGVLETEVCVVGGGPAGAALAARLAALGRSVVVCERSVLPREHVGESLSPGVWPVLDTLGVRERVEAAGFPPTILARVRWGGQERVRRSEPPRGRADRGRRVDVAPPGVTVDRGAFDALLLDHARRAGALVLSPATAARPVQRRDGWEVPVRRPDGPLRIAARFVADASGRVRLFGGARTPTSPATLALHALWRGGPRAETRIESRPDGWLWGAALPAGGFRAMALVDRGLLRERGVARGDLEALYTELLAGSELFARLGRRDGRVHACDATCFASATPSDERSIRVGEAAFAIDPLSSSGVQAALQTGLAAAATVHTVLTPGADAEAAREFYADHQRHATTRHTALAAASYAERGGDEPFWRARTGGWSDPRDLRWHADPARRGEIGADGGRGEASPRRAAGGRPLATLLDAPVRLSPAASLAPTPCLVDDRIERRRALVHPGLARPVAFLGGMEVAPLVDEFVSRRSLREALEAHGAAAPVAAWMIKHDLLEAA